MIIKRNDGTYVVDHNGSPYHVCSKDADPHGIYDITEVAAAWEAMPDGDPNKLTQADEEQTRADEQEIRELKELIEGGV